VPAPGEPGTPTSKQEFLTPKKFGKFPEKPKTIKIPVRLFISHFFPFVLRSWKEKKNESKKKNKERKNGTTTTTTTHKQGNSDPWDHTLYVWDNFVSKAQAEEIAIVAHSAGGLFVLF